MQSRDISLPEYRAELKAVEGISGVSENINTPPNLCGYYLQKGTEAIMPT